MQVIVGTDYAALCAVAADRIEKLIREKPDCRLGLATGSSPLGIYEELIRRCREEGLDFSRVRTVNLDEYLGLSPEHEQSYRSFMDRVLFDRVNIDKRNTFIPRGDGDPEESLREFRACLSGGEIDLQLLGLGSDGHIGFNEPGSVLQDRAHIEELDPSTIAANSRFFADPAQVPRRALTMGIGDIMRAKSLLLIISGSGKEEAAARLLLGGDVTCLCPATFLRLHRDATVLLSRELADRIGWKE